MDSVGVDSEDNRLSLFIYLGAGSVLNSGGLLKHRKRATDYHYKGYMNIFVGNLSLEVTEEELRQEFTAFGEVMSVTMMNDKYIGSGQQRGYAYVEMKLQSEGKAAISNLHRKNLRQMTINVIEALPFSGDRNGTTNSNKGHDWPGKGIRQRSYKTS